MIECGNDMNHALIGGNIGMMRDDGEPVPAFRARARQTALGLRADILIFELLEPHWVDDLPEETQEDTE